MDKPQHGRPKRAELPDVTINTGRLGAQSINSERGFFKCLAMPYEAHIYVFCKLIPQECYYKHNCVDSILCGVNTLKFHYLSEQIISASEVSLWRIRETLARPRVSCFDNDGKQKCRICLESSTRWKKMSFQAVSVRCSCQDCLLKLIQTVARVGKKVLDHS